jgi:DNA-binding transcriptional regulator YhcF (GntR family)
MEFTNNIPIYIQVIDDIKKNIVNGILPMGAKMPSGREMAIQYKINPNTANRIYKELETEGICFTKRGLGTFVTEDQDMLKRMREEMASKLFENFIEGTISLGFTKEEVQKLIDMKYDQRG